MASTSRMLARNLLPRPSPLLAPSTRPPMSTNCTAACTTFFDLRHRGQPVEAVVGHLGDADVRVLGGEGVRRGERAAAGEGVVQRGLARVGEADQAEAFHSEGVRLPRTLSARPGSLVDLCVVKRILGVVLVGADRHRRRAPVGAGPARHRRSRRTASRTSASTAVPTSSTTTAAPDGDRVPHRRRGRSRRARSGRDSGCSSTRPGQFRVGSCTFNRGIHPTIDTPSAVVAQPSRTTRLARRARTSPGDTATPPTT